LGQLEKFKVEYKLRSSHTYSEEVVINKECSFWDGFVCFKLNESHGIDGDKEYGIKVSGTAGSFITLENRK
jgi:hypothetical protein